MRPPAFLRFLHRLAETEDEELSCTECFDLLPRYVDLEIARGAEEQLPKLAQHLGQCGVCQEEYTVLRDLARLKAEGRLPSLDELRRSL